MSGPYAEILRALQLLTPEDGIFEVRALNPWTASGYFDRGHLEPAAKAIEALDSAGTYEGIYFSLNEINPALLSRRANRIETRMAKNAATTSDDDVIRRRWFVVDIDAERASGISSTDEEHSATLEVSEKIARFLSEFYEFPGPVVADSGNGAHLLYRIDLPNDEKSKTLIERCLQALGAAFDTPAKDGNPGWEVDPTMANAARICKLYGTLARKGDHTPERPHRRARILEAPEPIEVAPLEVLEALAARAPEEEPQQRARPRSGGYGLGIDLEDWLQEYGASLPTYHSKSRSRYQTFYEFEVCPWDPSHRDRSAWVGQLTSGALDAGCHHKSCTGNKWRDLRDLVEPKQARPKKPRTVKKTPAPAVEDDNTTDTTYNLTDAGNSERLVRLYGDRIRYCAPLKIWYVWDGRRWEIDETHGMLDLATQTARTIFNEAADAESVDEREAIAKWAIRSESLSSRRAMVDGAVFMVPVRPDELDAQANLFNCENGTLDLDTGEFREHRKEDLLTKLSGVRYDPGAQCPLWLDHLNTIFRGDADLIGGFQTLMGYSLLQYNPEQIMSILWGSGKNGKSETLKAIALILQDYAVNIESATLMQSRYTDAGRARPDVLRLKGARFTTCTEPEQNAVLSESLIKSVTGDHAVTARPLYGNPIEFVPGAKIFLATNHLPKIKGTDNGIWRRIWLFPFIASIPPEKRQPEYGNILFEQEGPGIFNWMLEGLRRYQEQGKLIQPVAVQRATREYRISANPVGLFITERCILAPQERIGKRELYRGYEGWCKAKGWPAWTMRRVGTLLKNIFEEYSDGTKRYWIGIRLKTAAERENEGRTVEEQGHPETPPDPPLTQPYTTSQTFPSNLTCRKVRGVVSDSVSEDTPPPAMAGGDNGDLASWFEKIRLPRDFTVANHRHNPDRPPGLCSVGLCNRQPTYEDETGSWPICERHYELIKQREEEAMQEVPV